MSDLLVLLCPRYPREATMRGDDQQSGWMFSYVSPEERVPIRRRCRGQARHRDRGDAGKLRLFHGSVCAMGTASGGRGRRIVDIHYETLKSWEQ